ncbi:MAG: sporulation protein [Rhodobacteraceae bacterium]|nr:sporulation protein [Paracoccaceae bacterium]MBT24824.1 sporulation protein [Paracoccaceae bacterium]
MPVSKVVSSAVLAVFLGGASVSAQVLGAALPAEFPPSSYKGKQYVDSKGCVYIRAGVAGNVTWVPRVTRSRQPICGAQPTFAKAKTPAPVKVAETPKPKPAPVQKKPVKVATAKPVVKPAKAPMRTVASVTTAPKRIVQAKPVVPVAAPKRVAPVRMAAPAAAAGCPQFGPSGRFMQGQGLRCGPQAESPVSYGAAQGRVASVATVTPGTVSPNTRVAPKHVYQQQVETTTGVKIPKGYRPVWKDDRLNPKRAHGTFAGKAQMDLVWTNTVPRKLVDRNTGKDVSRAHPNLVYPYTDLAVQQQQDAYKHMKRPVVATKGQVKAQAKTKARAVVSTRSAPVHTAPKATGRKYVQVGTFGVPANAQRTAAQLQRAGLPVRMGRYSKGGKQYQIVMAGPFASGAQLNAALNTARRAGFRDAFVR